MSNENHSTMGPMIHYSKNDKKVLCNRALTVQSPCSKHQWSLKNFMICCCHCHKNIKSVMYSAQ